MPKLGDGSVASSYFKKTKAPTGSDVKNQGGKVMIGQVDKIHFIDDPTNASKQYVEYDVIVRNEQGGQTTYKNLRSLVGSLGGFNDNDEIILESNETAFQGRLSPSNIFSNKNGTLVYVAFRDSSLDKPYIDSTVDHPKTLGARRADGIRRVGEFRGLGWEINKLGEFTLTYRGNRTPDGKLVREETGPTQIKIDQQGDLTLTNSANQEFKLSRSEDKFTLTFENGLSITFSGADDKAEIVTAGGTKVSVDGNGDDVTLETAGSGKLNLNAATVALGASGIEILDKLSTVVDLVSTWASSVGASHTHIGNLGYPTLVPDQASDYSTLGSDLASEKADVDSVKGSL